MKRRNERAVEGVGPYDWHDAESATNPHVGIYDRRGGRDFVYVTYGDEETRTKLSVQAELLCHALNHGYINVPAACDLLGFTR